MTALIIIIVCLILIFLCSISTIVEISLQKTENRRLYNEIAKSQEHCLELEKELEKYKGYCEILKYDLKNNKDLPLNMSEFKKLCYTEGCTCTSLGVDGREFNIDLTHQERKELCHQLIEKLNENDDTPLQEFFLSFVQQEGEFKHIGDCDCCGDSICEWKYNM